MDIKRRVNRLVKNFAGEMDALLITYEPSRTYLAGIKTTAGALLITPEQSYFLADFRYAERVRTYASHLQCELMETSMYETLAKLVKLHKIKELGFEHRYMPVLQCENLKKSLPKVKLIGAGGYVEQLRAIKDGEEVARIKAAQRMAEKAFEHILGFIKPGRTEREISIELEIAFLRAGADDKAFDVIALTGAKSSMPHGAPDDTPVKAGDFVTMDFGAMHQGYRSDMTRTVAVGHATDKMRSVYELTLKAQLKALEAVGPGMVCSEIDAVARDIIYAGGYKGCFGHGLGHGVGLEIHEEPRFSAVCDEITQPGMVMTVEPGIYIPGEFGVRIEDMGVITEDGFDNFTQSPKELIIL